MRCIVPRSRTRPAREGAEAQNGPKGRGRRRVEDCRGSSRVPAAPLAAGGEQRCGGQHAAGRDGGSLAAGGGEVKTPERGSERARPSGQAGVRVGSLQQRCDGQLLGAARSAPSPASMTAPPDVWVRFLRRCRGSAHPRVVGKPAETREPALHMGSRGANAVGRAM
ncbi:hypothetical protein VTO73DRAFT_6550 [Trametes versicolor]